MWTWLARRRHGCRGFEERLRAVLEGAEIETIEDAFDVAGANVREHVKQCGACRAELEDALCLRRLLRSNLPATADPGPAFTSLVLQTIADEERRRDAPENPWFAIPTMAARVAWVTGIVLLFASTWAYEQRPAAPERPAAKELSADAMPEPAPQPTTEDEVLLSLAGREP